MLVFLVFSLRRVPKAFRSIVPFLVMRGPFPTLISQGHFNINFPWFHDRLLAQPSILSTQRLQMNNLRTTTSRELILNSGDFIPNSRALPIFHSDFKK